MKERKNTAGRTRQSVESAQAGYGWQSFLSRYWVLAALVLILVFTAGIRLRLLEFPLERDEGEYAYMGQLMLQGVPPYQAAYNMKFPGTYAAYALIMGVLDLPHRMAPSLVPEFGQTVAGIHLGVLLVNAGAIILIFLIARKLWDALAGLMAAAAYALMTMSQMSLGMAGHATHFVVLAMLGGVLLMLKAVERDKVWMHFIAGSLFGIAILMKQPGILFVPMAGLYILWAALRQSPRRWIKTGLSLGAFALGVVLPLVITGLILWWAGVFGKFWYWTIVYAKAYGTQIPLPYGLQILVRGFPVLVMHTWPLWSLAGAGLILQFFNKNSRKRAMFLVSFTLFSFLAVCPGLIFRNHYFIMLMPAVAMLAATGLYVIREYMAQRGIPMAQTVVLLVFLGACGLVVSGEKRFLLKLSPDNACFSTYGGNPFIESVVLGKYLQEHTSPDDKIVVIGSEPQIYFYSHRRSATGYIYMYPLMEDQPDALRMQKEMAAEIEAANPRYLVFVSVRFSWLRQQGSQMWIISEWLNKYRQNYEVVGKVELLATGAQYQWGTEAASVPPTSPNFILICRRK